MAQQAETNAFGPVSTECGVLITIVPRATLAHVSAAEVYRCALKLDGPAPGRLMEWLLICFTLPRNYSRDQEVQCDAKTEDPYNRRKLTPSLPLLDPADHFPVSRCFTCSGANFISKCDENVKRLLRQNTYFGGNNDFCGKAG